MMDPTVAPFVTLCRKGSKLPVSDAAEYEEEELERRRWLLMDMLLRGYVSALIAPGGVGKTTLALVEAVSVVTGEPLAGYDVMEQTRALVFNAEDPLVEMQMRLAGVCRHFDIDRKSLRGKLTLLSGRDFHMRLIRKVGDDYEVNEEILEVLIDYIRQNGIGLLVLDPFVRIHDCPENDNGAIDKVVQLLSETLAHKEGIAVLLAHHSRKLNGEGGAGDADSARGASSLTSACRISHTISKMTEKDALNYGIDPDRKNWYVRLDDAKLNLTPPADKIIWFERHGVKLANGETVGTLERVGLTKVDPNADAAQETAEFLTAVAIIIGGEADLSLREAAEAFIRETGDSRTCRCIQEKLWNDLETPFMHEDLTLKRHKASTGQSRRRIVCEGFATEGDDL